MNQQDEATSPQRGVSSGTGQVVTWILVLVYGAAVVCCVVLVSRGQVEVGVYGLLLVLTTAPVAFVVVWAVRALERMLARELARVEATLNHLASRAGLSDDARRVLNREQERAMLRTAIEEDLQRGRVEGAMALTQELAERFGHRADAEQFRKRIDQARAQSVDRVIQEAAGRVQSLVAQQQFEAAEEEVASLRRLYPDSPRPGQLLVQVKQALAAHKAELERRFLLAARDERADEAMAILRDLDRYLTPHEAEPLRELARGIIGKARDNLGAQFKLAVHDRRWDQAAALGDRIIEQFPNSRMAAEVRDVLDGIRARVGK